jgi:hypothetical protein
MIDKGRVQVNLFVNSTLFQEQKENTRRSTMFLHRQLLKVKILKKERNSALVVSFHLIHSPYNNPFEVFLFYFKISDCAHFFIKKQIDL